MRQADSADVAEVNQTIDSLADRIDSNFKRLEGKIDELAKRPV